MSETPAGHGDLLRIPDAAARLQVSESTVWRWVHGGKLPSVKLGKARRIRAESLERFIEKGEEALTGEAFARSLKPLTADSPFWKTLGMFTGDGAPVSENIHYYVGEAIAAHKLSSSPAASDEKPLAGARKSPKPSKRQKRSTARQRPTSPK